MRLAATSVGAGLMADRLPEGCLSAGEPVTGPLRFGIITDVHYADADTKGSRYYRDSLAKLRQAVETFNRLDLAFVVELGDFIDAGASKEDELDYLRTADKVYQTFKGNRHYVLGNHCVGALTKQEFLTGCGAKNTQSYYSFDSAGYHFIVLDANFKQDGTPYSAGNFTWTDTGIPETEQEWLRQDLAAAGEKPSIVFVHQNLDDEKDAHGVKNAPEIRRILERSGKVAAVFQGHKHTGGYVRIGGIPYCTLKAMVERPTLENNSYAVAIADGASRLKLEGFGRQEDMVVF